MNFEKVFKLLIVEFQQNKIDCALIGGFALYFAGFSRTTLDIDFTVLLEQSDKINDIMIKYGYNLLYKSKDVANYSSQFAELGRVDFLFAHRKYALKMLNRAEYKEIFGHNVKVLKPEDIIGLKVQSSSNDPQRYYKDMADIEEIIKINFEKVDLKIIKEYFKLFDREKEIEDIIGRIK